MHSGPLFAAYGILAGIIRARSTGEPTYLDIAQSDASVAMDWLRIETYLAYERPEDVVTGNPADDYERREPGTAGMLGGVRYQFYDSSDGMVLFMSSEQEFWKNFCGGVDRMDLFEKWPGSQYGDHARGNRELQRELVAIFASKTTEEWVEFADEVNTPICPVNTPKTVADDPQFQDRFPLLGHEEHGADMIGSAIHLVGEELPVPTRAPTVGQHNDEILAEVLGYDEAKVAALRQAGALGAPQ